ncbi:hypothetical protein EUGRSUZ_H03838 [Eucalyptus grandis]|uniref:Uncharacterized protein n=2 Tax=Eucalyptus grandis TaxID=71139 RepID=A0ACC3JW71_EUCGR|nr:hypothetical protein EUGRSUZ_H03838 [Eucalyptus grandis]
MLWRSYKMKKDGFHLGSGINSLRSKLPPVTGERSYLASPMYHKSSYSQKLIFQYSWCIGHMMSLAGVKNHGAVAN